MSFAEHNTPLARPGLDPGPLFARVKGPLALCLVSGAIATAAVLLWTRFPSTAFLVAVCAILFPAAVTAIISEVVLVLRLARILVPVGPLAAEVPRRTAIALSLLLGLANGGLIYLSSFRPSPLPC